MVATLTFLGATGTVTGRNRMVRCRPAPRRKGAGRL